MLVFLSCSVGWRWGSLGKWFWRGTNLNLISAQILSSCLQESGSERGYNSSSRGGRGGMGMLLLVLTDIDRNCRVAGYLCATLTSL
jgi:hypothetical protein